MSTHDETVSPYLRHRQRSYEEAMSQRGISTRPGERPEVVRSVTHDATVSRETTSLRSGR